MIQMLKNYFIRRKPQYKSKLLTKSKSNLDFHNQLNNCHASTCCCYFLPYVESSLQVFMVYF